MIINIKMVRYIGFVLFLPFFAGFSGQNKVSEEELKESDFLYQIDKTAELSAAQKKPILLLTTLGKIDSVAASKCIEAVGGG
ncbi:MAG: hypothetical protein HY606_09280 [Planctomycetes bacterium]|nr:hypothetical protein [Planctomycetota bacterium]